MIEDYVEQSLGGSGEPVDVTTTIIEVINELDDVREELKELFGMKRANRSGEF